MSPTVIGLPVPPYFFCSISSFLRLLNSFILLFPVSVDLILKSSFFDTWAGSTFLYPIILPRLLIIGSPFSSTVSSSWTSSSFLSTFNFLSSTSFLWPFTLTDEPVPPPPPVPPPTSSVVSFTLLPNSFVSSSSFVFSNLFHLLLIYQSFLIFYYLFHHLLIVSLLVQL